MRAWTRITRPIAAICACRRGVSSVEFALAAPLFITILTLLVDFGVGFYEKMEVEDAAQAGTQYALLHGWNENAIRDAVTGATTLSGVRATPAATKACGCPSGSAITAADCTGTCASGLSAGTYVTVNAKATYTPLFTYPLFGSSVTLTAQSVVRIQ